MAKKETGPGVTKTPRVVVYARVSSQEQARNETAETQLDVAREWAKQRRVMLLKVYVDNAVSGAIPFDKRPAGRQLLDDAKQGLFNTIVVYSISRIGRLASVAHLAKSELEGLEVGIISLIVSPEQWHAARRALMNRQQWAKRNAHSEYLLSGFLRCGYCGRRLFGHTIGPKERKKPLYTCAGTMKENRPYLVHSCEQRRIPLAWIESLIWQELSGWILHHQDLEAEVRRAFDHQEADRSEWQASLTRIEKDLASLEEQRQNLLRAFRKGLLSDKDLEQHVKEITAEREHLQTVQQEFAKRLSEVPDVDSVVAGIRTHLIAFRASLKKGTVPFAVKRKIVETFVSAITIRIPRDSDLPALTQMPLRSTIPFRPDTQQYEEEKGRPTAPGKRTRVFQRGDEKPEPSPAFVHINYKFSLLEPTSLQPIVSTTSNG